MKDADGNVVWIPGTLKGCKAIGWYIEEYGIAQVSMNVTNINVTPVHVAFDEVCDKAHARGLRVTGSEIVGLIPKKVLIDAGKYFLAKQNRSCGIPEEDIVKIAVKSMGLDDLKPFNPREKVIEYILEDSDRTPKLVDLTVRGFAEETSRESPAPGLADRFQHTWDRSEQPSEPWSPTFHPTRGVGTTSVPNSPYGQRRAGTDVRAASSGR